MRRSVRRVGRNLLDARLDQLAVLDLAARLDVDSVQLAHTGGEQGPRGRRAPVFRRLAQWCRRSRCPSMHVDGDVRRDSADLVDELLESDETHVEIVLNMHASQALHPFDSGLHASLAV